MNNEIPRGYVQLNETDQIYINREGSVFNAKTGSISTAHSYGEVVLHSYSSGGCEKSFQLSRAIAKNFLPVPQALSGIPLYKLTVRFKDGNKHNIDISNLYWDHSNKCKAVNITTEDGTVHCYSSVEAAWLVHGTASYSAFLAAVRKGELRKAKIKIEVIG